MLYFTFMSFIEAGHPVLLERSGTFLYFSTSVVPVQSIFIHSPGVSYILMDLSLPLVLSGSGRLCVSVAVTYFLLLMFLRLFPSHELKLFSFSFPFYAPRALFYILLVPALFLLIRVSAS